MRNAVLTEKGPKPIGPYSQAIIEGDFVFVAGQGCTNPETGELELPGSPPMRVTCVWNVGSTVGTR